MMRRFFRFLASIPLAYVAVSFYLPLLLMFLVSVSGEKGVSIYFDVLLNENYVRIALYSLYIAALTTLSTLVLSLPAAYYLAFYVPERYKMNILLAFNIPLLINLLLKAYALLNLLSFLGLANTFTGMMVGMVYEYLPLMFLPIYSSFERINRRLLEAAETLGARPREKFFKVVLPLSLPGIISGVTLVSLMAFTEFVIPAMLGGIHGYTLGYLIWDLFLKFRNWEAGSALSFAVTLVAVLVATIYSVKGERVEV